MKRNLSLLHPLLTPFGITEISDTHRFWTAASSTKGHECWYLLMIARFISR